MADRFAKQGRLTFAEYMELALYWPGGGYYARPRTAGHDYFTAPAAHPAFGALLALQLEEMWETLGRPADFVVLEPGAGWGHLARDVAGYAGHLSPRFASALRYVAIDRVAAMPANLPSTVQWLRAAGVPLRHVTGVVLSNELFDALPVHRVVVRNGSLREVYVINDQGRLADAEGEPSSPALAQRLAEEGIALAEGQQAEVCLALAPWLREASDALERGFLLTIDYGHTAAELYGPQRLKGTLRCYFQHTVSASPYDYPGGQDITAHVDFTALERMGARHGLESYPLVRQGAFLRNLGLGDLQRRLTVADLRQGRRDANRMAMLEIARSGSMGDFRVLVQRKNAPASRLTGLEGPLPAWKERLARLPLPLLDDAHLEVMAARYPHLAGSYEDLWG